MPTLDVVMKFAAAAGHPGREGRRPGARDARDEQPAPHARRRRGARARLRPPAHPPPRRPRRVHRRQGHRRGGRTDARPRRAGVPRPRAARHRHRGLDDLHRGRGTREAVDGRLSEIRAELARATDYRDVEVLEERFARLSLSLAVIRVGAPTEVVRNERLRRTEGALAATQAAVSEGIVAGGGTALLRSAPALDALGRGRVRARRRRRAHRAERAAVLDRLERRLRRPGDDRPGQGDARRSRPRRADGRVRRPLRERRRRPGARHAPGLEHAASVAALMLTTEALVAEELIAQPGAIIAPGSGTSRRAWRGRRPRSETRSAVTAHLLDAEGGDHGLRLLDLAHQLAGRTASPCHHRPAGAAGHPAARRAFV